ncbi:MAG: hypothetical protein RSD23_08100 [Ruthenibacterium sp.]
MEILPRTAKYNRLALDTRQRSPPKLTLGREAAAMKLRRLLPHGE